MTAQLDIQKAMKAVMIADTGSGGLMNTTTPMITGVHDYVPPSEVPPYIVLGEATEQPRHTFARRAYEVTAMVDVWTDSPAGMETVLQIVERVNTLIDDNPGVGQSAALAAQLSPLGWSLVWCQYRGTSEGQRGQDDLVRSKRIMYSVFVQATS